MRALTNNSSVHAGSRTPGPRRTHDRAATAGTRMRKRPFVETLLLVPAVAARSVSYLGPGVLTVASAFALFGIAPPATLLVPLRDTCNARSNVQTPAPSPGGSIGARLVLVSS